jgi:hypothetical protein
LRASSTFRGKGWLEVKTPFPISTADATEAV